jgi:hypothetical protein
MSRSLPPAPAKARVDKRSRSKGRVIKPPEHLHKRPAGKRGRTFSFGRLFVDSFGDRSTIEGRVGLRAGFAKRILVT